MKSLRVFALVGILVPTVSAQAPPEELSNLRKVLGVSEETALLGPNALRVPPIPTGRSVRVYVTAGFETAIHANVIGELQRLNNMPAADHLRLARKQKEQQLKETVKDKGERSRLLAQWTTAYQPPIFEVVTKLEDADIVLVQYSLVQRITQKIQTRAERVTTYKAPSELSGADRDQNPMGRPDSATVPKTSSQAVVPVFGYILRAQDKEFVVIHRYQAEDSLEGGPSSGLQLVGDLWRLVTR